MSGVEFISFNKQGTEAAQIFIAVLFLLKSSNRNSHSFFRLKVVFSHFKIGFSNEISLGQFGGWYPYKGIRDKYNFER